MKNFYFIFLISLSSSLFAGEQVVTREGTLSLCLVDKTNPIVQGSYSPGYIRDINKWDKSMSVHVIVKLNDKPDERLVIYLPLKMFKLNDAQEFGTSGYRLPLTIDSKERSEYSSAIKIYKTEIWLLTLDRTFNQLQSWYNIFMGIPQRNCILQ